MRDVAALSARYGIFALIATAINLASQWLALRCYDGAYSLALAMAFGTATGLVAKYVLDKRWIFNDQTQGLQNHARKFSLYAVMGVATTAIFWGSEFLFDAVSRNGRMRFVGGAIGLGIGYFAKYQLDRRFVFRGAH